MQKRLTYIDIAKCIAIIGIISVHIPTGPVLLISETFHVSTFFLLVGIIFSLHEVKEQSFSTEIRKKVRGLMYPYAMLSVCNISMLMILSLIWGKYDILISGINKTLLLRGIGTLWFLPIPFIGEMLFLKIIGVIHNSVVKKIVLPLVLLASVYVLYVPQFGVEQFVSNIDFRNIFSHGLTNWLALLLISVLVCTTIISIGYSFGKSIEKVSNGSRKSNILVIVVFLISLAFDIWLHKYYHCDLHKGTLSPTFVYFGCSILGSVTVIMLSILISQLNNKVSEAFGWFGKNSLIVMVTHKEFFIVHSMYLCTVYFHTNAIITSFFTTILTIIVEVFLVNVVNKTKLRKIFYFK